MSKILIIGAGAMGSAFSFPCVDNGHKVNIIGSPLENKTIDELKKNYYHQALSCNLPKNISFLKADKLQDELKNNPDLLVIGVNSKGINWITKELESKNFSNTPLLLLTKGLSIFNNNYESLKKLYTNLSLPDIAIEGKNGKVSLVALDKKNSNSNQSSIVVGEADSEFKAFIKTENMKLIPGDYDVVLSKKKIAHFKNQKVKVEYWIALEADSVFN